MNSIIIIYYYNIIIINNNNYCNKIASEYIIIVTNNKGIHFTIIDHLYICMHEKPKKSSNQLKQRPTAPNNPIFKTILLSIYRILNLALLIMNVSVESKYNVINWH